MVRGNGVQDVACGSRIAVVPIKPDARGRFNVVDAVATDDHILAGKQLDGCALPILLHVLPADVVNVILGDRGLAHCVTLDAAGPGVGNSVPADDEPTEMIGHLLVFRIGGDRLLVEAGSHLGAHRVHLAHNVVFNDPVVPAVHEDRAGPHAGKSISGMLKNEALHFDVVQPSFLGREQVLLHRYLECTGVGVVGAKGVDVQFVFFLIHPVRARNVHQVLVVCELGQTPPVLENQASR